MSRSLKNIVIDGLKSEGCKFVALPSQVTPHTKGVRYFTLVRGMDALRGAIDVPRLGYKRRKRIIVRPSRRHEGLHELYTYHFPTHWSQACLSNREMIKEAQRQAHALEHGTSDEAYEWRIRFFSHYFRVVKGHEKPAPGMKPYAHFYQFAYVSIYRDLQASLSASPCDSSESFPASTSNTAELFTASSSESSAPIPAEEISFVPVLPSRFRRRNYLRLSSPPPLPSPLAFLTSDL